MPIYDKFMWKTVFYTLAMRSLSIFLSVVKLALSIALNLPPTGAGIGMAATMIFIAPTNVEFVSCSLHLNLMSSIAYIYTTWLMTLQVIKMSVSVHNFKCL